MIDAQWPCEGKVSQLVLPWKEIELLIGDVKEAREEFLYVPSSLHAKQRPSPRKMGFFQ
jgi:hypothetical protein